MVLSTDNALLLTVRAYYKLQHRTQAVQCLLPTEYLHMSCIIMYNTTDTIPRAHIVYWTETLQVHIYCEKSFRQPEHTWPKPFKCT